LEYNARFGDPEAMNVLPIMKNDFVAVCQAIIDGSLHKIRPDFKAMATVCKYAVPKGYPIEPVSGKIFLGEVPNPITNETDKNLPQAKFIIDKFQGQAERILNAPSDIKTRQHVYEQFNRLAHSPSGVYALIDYGNFKGSGTLNSGDWGLLQVLENMEGSGTGKQALADFTKSAKTVLKNRAQNSKTKKIDGRNLAGWYKRVDTYCQ